MKRKDDIPDSLIQNREQELKLNEMRKFNSILTIVKTCGDLVTAYTGSGIAKKVFGKAPNDGMVGIGGSVSAIITLFTLFMYAK